MSSIFAATPEKATVLVLNGQNFDDWKLRCNAFFRSRKLTRCITTSPTDRARILSDPESKEADKWEQDEADAVYQLLTTLGKDDSPSGKDLMTGLALSVYEIWTTVWLQV
jgi:hypothetical protein